MRPDIARFLDPMNQGELALLADVIDRRIGAATRAVEPYRALVATGTGTGLVTLQTLDDVAPRQEEFARLDTGVWLDVGDEVVCIDVAGKPFVLGRVRRTNGYPVANLLISGEHDGTDYQTTDVVNFADGISRTITLPAGTWDVSVLVVGHFRHTALGVADMQLSIGGTVLTSLAHAATTGNSATDYVTLSHFGSRLALPAGSCVCKAIFHSTTAGTITFGDASITIMSERVP